MFSAGLGCRHRNSTETAGAIGALGLPGPPLVPSVPRRHLHSPRFSISSSRSSFPCPIARIAFRSTAPTDRNHCPFCCHHHLGRSGVRHPPLTIRERHHEHWDGMGKRKWKGTDSMSTAQEGDDDGRRRGRHHMFTGRLSASFSPYYVSVDSAMDSLIGDTAYGVHRHHGAVCPISRGLDFGLALSTLKVA